MKDGGDMSKVDELLWQMWLDEHGEEDFDEHKTKIKQAIQALIADQMAEYQAQLLKDYKEDIATAVREARIDELEHIVSGSEYSADDFDWYEKTQDEYTGTRYYSEVRHLSKTDRIAELKAQQEEV
jgi:hypothetical protein